jgi:hypothetical protein
MLLGIQLIGVLFALFMMYLVFLNYKRKDILIHETFFWLAVWLVFIIIAVFPAVLNPFVETLNITRIMDFIIIAGFAFIIGIVFKNRIDLKKMQRKQEELVRKVAYKDLKAK